MNTKLRTAFIFLFVIVALGSFTACKYFNFGGDSFKEITAQELTALVDTFPDQAKRQIAQNDKQRQDLLKKVKEVFSLAQAAQAEGSEKTDKYKQQLDFMTERFLAEADAKQASGDGSKPPAETPEAELTAYATAHTKEYETFVKMMTEGSKEQPTKEQIENGKKGWADLKIRADRARKAGLDKTPDTLLQLKLQRAQLLAGLYQEKLGDKMKPTPEELKEYYAAHPEADPEKIKQQAEDVLKRVKAGEDFAALAKQYSGDGSAKDGGLLRWFGKGRMVKEFEEVAYKLEKGKISDLVKSQFGYHIIKVEDRQTRAPKKGEDDVTTDGEQELVLARHILFMTREATDAEQKLTQKKMTRAVEDATLKYPVAAPADFVVNVKGVKADEMPGLRLPGAGGDVPPTAPAAPAAPQGSPAPSVEPKKK